jgi:diketogulonate reductase-like aldo/keto reductase
VLQKRGSFLFTFQLFASDADKVRAETWKAFEFLLKEGKVKAIGVSNYTITHLTSLLKTCTVVPAVNQVEFHPLLFQKDLLEFCKKNNIVLESYSPFCKGEVYQYQLATQTFYRSQTKRKSLLLVKNTIKPQLK